MTTITEFTSGKVCTATIHQALDTGEAVSGPLHVGYYPADPEQDPSDHEIWLEQESHRVQVFVKNLPALIKQLKRAQALAREQAQ